MDHQLVITIPDSLQERLIQAAMMTQQTPEEWIRSLIQRQLPPRDPRLRRHFGAVDLGHPTGTDNVQIDADLVRAYVDEHREP